MRKKLINVNQLKNSQLGLTMIELLVAMAIGVTIMSGVLSMIVTSKNNFITERELATLQENARFAMKFMTDEIRMAGYSGCISTPLNQANSVNIAGGTWYLDGTGISGFEHEAGTASFPNEFKADVLANTDVVVIRRGEKSGLQVDGNHNPNSAVLPLNNQHAYKPGQIMMIATPNCQQVGIFQLSGPTNNGNNASIMVHNTGGSTTPGNCTKKLGGNFDCGSPGSATTTAYPPGSTIMEMRSLAFYVGSSNADATVPALFIETLIGDEVNETFTTVAQELVQGVENMQILYGLDNTGNDGIADIYMKANDGAMDWDNVVTVRLSMRMRSVNPVYNNDENFAVFEGVAGTNGSDRFMHQDLSTTIRIRNR